jgi:hypothetical protein
MSLRVVVEPRLGLLDGPQVAGALEHYALELGCDACRAPIADAGDAWAVWSAQLSWAERGTTPWIAHAGCRDRLLKAKYAWDDRADVRLAPLLDLIAPPLARLLRSSPIAAPPEPPKSRRAAKSRRT